MFGFFFFESWNESSIKLDCIVVQGFYKESLTPASCLKKKKKKMFMVIHGEISARVGAQFF